MKLNYSLGNIEDDWIADDLPFGSFQGKSVRIVTDYPDLKFSAPAKLLVATRPGEGAITILGEYCAGLTPPSNAPASTEGWEDVPSSPIIQQVRITLDAEAIRSLQLDADSEADYVLTIPSSASITRLS